jgi:hypothetical protein
MYLMLKQVITFCEDVNDDNLFYRIIALK